MAKPNNEAPSNVKLAGSGTAARLREKTNGSIENETTFPRLSQSAKLPVPGVPVKKS